MLKNKIKLLLILILIFVIPNLCVAASDFPAFPMSFYGSASYDGNPLEAGTKIEAFVGDELVGEIEMLETGIYGYDIPSKGRLVVGEFTGDLLFKYVPAGTSEPLTGDTELKYTGGFASGEAVLFDLAFTKVSPPPPPPVPSGGGGGAPTDNTAPAQPTNFSVNRNGNSATLKWKNPSDSDLNGVILVRNITEISGTVLGKDLKSSGDLMYEGGGETFTDENTDINTAYYYALTAYDKKQNYSKPIIIKAVLESEQIIEPEEVNNDEEVMVLGAEYDADSDVELIIEETIKKEKELMAEVDINLSKRVSGRILLQVEEHGEAWYILPKDNKKYYMANGNKAYSIMRYLSVGITNKDLERVMIDKDFAKKHSGKIFLQVEAHGEAYYIDFDGNAHYLKDGIAAYSIMRNLGLGITNSDIRKIEVGEID